MASGDDEATLSIPSLAFVAFLSFFIIRYFMSSRSSNSEHSQRRNGQRFTPAQVEQITQMFPQLNRRDVMWDLQRNGGSVAATTERILGGRGLDPVRWRKVNAAGPMTDIETGTAIISTPSANPRFVFNFDPDTCSPKGC